MKRNIVIPSAAVTAVLLLAISGVRESRYTYETQPGGCVQVQGGGFAGRQYPGGMAMGAGGGLLFWLDQGGPELELTAEFPDKAVPVSISLGELGGMNGTPVFVPADENYYKHRRAGAVEQHLCHGGHPSCAGGRPGGDIRRNIRDRNWPPPKS